VSPQRKRIVLIACIMGSAVVAVDSTVVNVALPAIRADLGGGFAGQQWTANAYLVTLASLILVGGSLGDVIGERRVFEAGLIGFGVTSLLCAVAPTIETLVLARALQGVSGALLTPAALAVIVAVFPRDERGKAVGSWTAWSAVGVVIGPLIGGWLVDAASWRWIFALNLPLVLATLVLSARVIPDRRGGKDDSTIDVLGGVSCALGLAALTFGLVRAPAAGLTSPSVLLTLLAAVGLLASFLVHERRTAHPMLPLDLFRNRNFAIGNLQTLSMYAGLSLLFFFLVLYLQQVAGYDAVAAGTASLPVTIVMFLSSSRFGALADRFGPRLFMGVGPLVCAAGLASLTGLGSHVDYVTDLLPRLFVFAVGLSMTVAPLTATVLAAADEGNAGTASGVNNAIARTAGLLGIAVVGTIVAARYGARSDSSPGAFHLAMGISAVLVALGGVASLVGIRNPAREVEAASCPGGQLAGAPAESTRVNGDAAGRPVAVAGAGRS
jgi:EmrB/QacA subfamily drug resistance transporter